MQPGQAKSLQWCSWGSSNVWPYPDSQFFSVYSKLYACSVPDFLPLKAVIVGQRKHLWTWPWELHRSCSRESSTLQGSVPAHLFVVYISLYRLHVETFTPVSCNPQRTGSSRTALILSLIAFLSSLACHFLHEVEACIQISSALRQKTSIWKCGSQGSLCCTSAGLGLCRAVPRTLVKLFIQCCCYISFFERVRSETISANSSLSTTDFLNYFWACQMSAMQIKVIIRGAAFAEKLSHTQALNFTQDYGWFLAGGEIQDIRVNAVVVHYRLQLYKLPRGEN